MTTVTLQHVSVELALHQLREGEGRPLLLLHGLGERTPRTVPTAVEAWPGPIWGLDFTGHGDSTIPGCAGYTAELLVADVDHALDHLGTATLLGRGLGAYIALLTAGARPELVTGAVLLDGPGIDGGGPSPHSPMVFRPASARPELAVPDRYALIDLSNDIRPPDYAQIYTRQALEYSGVDEPIFVSAVVRPPWLKAVADDPAVVVTDLDDALKRAAALVD